MVKNSGGELSKKTKKSSFSRYKDPSWQYKKSLGQKNSFPFGFNKATIFTCVLFVIFNLLSRIGNHCFMEYRSGGFGVAEGVYVNYPAWVKLCSLFEWGFLYASIICFAISLIGSIIYLVKNRKKKNEEYRKIKKSFFVLLIVTVLCLLLLSTFSQVIKMLVENRVGQCKF